MRTKPGKKELSNQYERKESGKKGRVWRGMRAAGERVKRGNCITGSELQSAHAV